jgi:hypothetical protein
MMPYPNYNDLDVLNYELLGGYYTLGLAQTHRPDLSIIHDSFFQMKYNETDLCNTIDQELLKNKTVCLCVTDEDFITPVRPTLTKALNHYKNSPVYLITQLDESAQKMYSFQHGLEIKMLELPWWMLNDCLCYYCVTKNKDSAIFVADSGSFICMIGRHDSFKMQLPKALVQTGLHDHGSMTLLNWYELTPDQNAFAKKYCKPSDLPSYTSTYINAELNSDAMKISSLYAENNSQLKISQNVHNFLLIEQHYKNTPMVIHPESTGGIFLNTEKSLWPLLIGKLALIKGRPGVMSSIQRFYNVDFSQIFNMEFDDLGGYSCQDHWNRTLLMLEKNQQTIINSHAIHQQYAEQIESARWSLGENMYNFFCSQLETIPRI